MHIMQGFPQIFCVAFLCSDLTISCFPWLTHIDLQLCQPYLSFDFKKGCLAALLACPLHTFLSDKIITKEESQESHSGLRWPLKLDLWLCGIPHVSRAVIPSLPQKLRVIAGGDDQLLWSPALQGTLAIEQNCVHSSSTATKAKLSVFLGFFQSQ